jgi:hypothetical protein
MGGDLRHLDDATLALLTNDEVLAVNQATRDNREVLRSENVRIWQARPVQGEHRYAALFNMREQAQPLQVPLWQFGFEGVVRVRDLWQKQDLGVRSGFLMPEIPGHGAGLYRLTGV